MFSFSATKATLAFGEGVEDGDDLTQQSIELQLVEELAGLRTLDAEALVARQPFDVLRPLSFDTPLLFPVWFRPSGRPILGGIQG